MADQADVEEAFVSATGSEPSPGAGEELTATNSSSDTSELGVQMEALAFVAGYVAFKCQAIDPSLGCRASQAAPGLVPDRWLRLVSRGGLTMPSERWMATVKEFEIIFCLVMGGSVDRSPGIVRRLVACLAEKEPSLDHRVIRKLVKTRLHIRVRWLNVAKLMAAAKRRSDGQIRHHARSGL